MAFSSPDSVLNKRPFQQQQISFFSAVILAPKSSPMLKPILSASDVLSYSGFLLKRRDTCAGHGPAIDHSVQWWVRP